MLNYIKELFTKVKIDVSEIKGAPKISWKPIVASFAVSYGFWGGLEQFLSRALEVNIISREWQSIIVPAVWFGSKLIFRHFTPKMDADFHVAGNAPLSYMGFDSGSHTIGTILDGPTVRLGEWNSNTKTYSNSIGEFMSYTKLGDIDLPFSWFYLISLAGSVGYLIPSVRSKLFKFYSKVIGAGKGSKKREYMFDLAVGGLLAAGTGIPYMAAAPVVGRHLEKGVQKIVHYIKDRTKTNYAEKLSESSQTSAISSQT